MKTTLKGQIIPTLRSFQCWSLLTFFFFIWVEILVLGMMSNFQLYPGHLGYHAMRLWSYLNFLFLLASSDTRLVVEKGDHLVTSRWEWRSRFPIWPLLTACRVGCLVTLGWRKVQAPISPSQILPWWEGEECLLQLGKCKSLGFPFGLCWWVGAMVFSRGAWLRQYGSCLQIFCLPRLPLSWSFSYRREPFLVVFFPHSYWHFWVVGFCCSSLEYIRRKEKSLENSQLCGSSGPKVPSQYSIFSYLFYI